MSVVEPGTVRRESANAFPLGECNGSVAEAELKAVRRATVAARSSVVFITLIFLRCAALRRLVHALEYAGGGKIPHEMSGK
jgi:hypothetical protein